MTVNEDTAELIDLKEEKIYKIDLKKKTYSVATFEEIRRQMEDAMAKAKAQAQAQTAKANEPAPQDKPDVKIDFKLSETGQKKMIGAYNTREVLATVTITTKDKKTGDEGSMMMNSSMWLAPKIAALKELEDFDRKVAEKLYLPIAREMAAQMAPAMGMYPGLSEGMARLEKEKVNMNGTAILTSVSVDAVAKPAQTAQTGKEPPAAQPQQNKQPEIPRSLGGLLGGLRRGGKGNDDSAKTNDNNKPASLMTTNHELLSVSTSVAEADVAIPVGFKEIKEKN
jgi:hypothetical protein